METDKLKPAALAGQQVPDTDDAGEGLAVGEIIAVVMAT